MPELRSEYCKVCLIRKDVAYDVCAYCRVEEGVRPFGAKIPGSSTEVREWMVQEVLRGRAKTLELLIRQRIQAAVAELSGSWEDLELLCELECCDRIAQAASALKLACVSAAEAVRNLSSD